MVGLCGFIWFDGLISVVAPIAGYSCKFGLTIGLTVNSVVLFLSFDFCFLLMCLCFIVVFAGLVVLLRFCFGFVCL